MHASSAYVSWPVGGTLCNTRTLLSSVRGDGAMISDAQNGEWKKLNNAPQFVYLQTWAALTRCVLSTEMLS